MLRYMGMCCPNRLVFYQRSHFHQKILKRGSHFMKIAKKKKSYNQPFLKWKIGIRNGSWFLKISKKQSNQPFFCFLFFIFFLLRAKNSQVWLVFQSPGLTPCQKIIWIPLQNYICFQVKILLFFRTSSVMHQSSRFTPATCLIFLIYRVQSSLM